MLLPVLAVVRPQDDNLTLSASEAGKVRDLDDDGAEELGAARAQLQHPRSDGLSLHQRWRVDQLVLLQISANRSVIGIVFSMSVLSLPAGDPHGHGRFPRGDDDSDPGVSASSHGSAPGVHHEADQEP